MDDTRLAAIVDAVVRELKAAGVVQPASSSATQLAAVSQPSTPSSVVPVKPRSTVSGSDISIDLPDPVAPEIRYKPLVKNPKDTNGLNALVASTTARIGVGRAGPRYKTA